MIKILIFKHDAAESDIQNYLHNKDKEAVVQCLTDKYEIDGGPRQYRYYKAIASSKKNCGSLLIIDDNYDFCWVPRQLFKTIFDPYHIL